MRYAKLRGARMKRIVEISSRGGTWTTQQYAKIVGVSAETCYHAVMRLVAAGYLEEAGEIKNPRGGRPIGVYRWTGKVDNREAPRVDLKTIFNCISAMARCGEPSVEMMAG